MRIENRELFVIFWDTDAHAGVVALLIGWQGDDPSFMRPVIAYNYGVEVLHEPFELAIDVLMAGQAARAMTGPV